MERLLNKRTSAQEGLGKGEKFIESRWMLRRREAL
jgi:hypothetical protein